MFVDLLKQHNLSVTAVRIAVLNAVKKHAHIDANTIYTSVQNEISTASKQAIYNNLHALVDCGIIREINPTGVAALYEFEHRDNHHHLVCRSCNAIVDVDCQGQRPCLPIKDNHGFVIDEAEITFWGICPTCQLTEKGEK